MCDRVPPLFVGDVRTSANQFDTASAAEDVRVFEFESSRAARLSRSNVGIARLRVVPEKSSSSPRSTVTSLATAKAKRIPPLPMLRVRRSEIIIEAIEKRRCSAQIIKLVAWLESEPVHRDIQIQS